VEALIKVKLLERGSVIELEARELKVVELLEKFGLSPSEHIVLRNGEVVTEEDTLHDGDEVVIFTVKSGG
jgi:sulfur carrier protein